jgi:hypothetical protein
MRTRCRQLCLWMVGEANDLMLLFCGKTSGVDPNAARRPARPVGAHPNRSSQSRTHLRSRPRDEGLASLADLGRCAGNDSENNL